MKCQFQWMGWEQWAKLHLNPASSMTSVVSVYSDWMGEQPGKRQMAGLLGFRRNGLQLLPGYK